MRKKQGFLHTVAKENDTLKIGDVVGTIDDTAEKPAGKRRRPAKERGSPKSRIQKETKSEASGKKRVI